MEKYRNPMTRPTNFSNPAGNVVDRILCGEHNTTNGFAKNRRHNV